MKKRKIVIGSGLLMILLISSFLLSQWTNIAASHMAKALDGVQIVLDAGHGGKDDGARSNEVKEQEINLKITKKLQALLLASGASVTLTRTDANDLASLHADNRKKEDMKRRVEIIEDIDVDLFLSIHLNAYPDTKVYGAQAFYKPDDDRAKAFADVIQSHLKEISNTKMTSKPGDFYILNNTSKVGSLVECGFLSNAQDREKLVTDAYQQRIAETLYASILEYFQYLL